MSERKKSRIDAPWTVQRAEHTTLGTTYDVVEFFPEEASTGAIVARVHPSIRGVQGKEESLPKVHERALVMAAAPELLAACAAALGNSANSKRVDCLLQDAIAKAMGA